MVYYSERALLDLRNIFDGLLSWEKYELEYSHVVSYHNDLKNTCKILDQALYHAPCNYLQHKEFGNYVHRYRRNKNTTWYIIYNKDEYKNIFIQRIISNHLTENANR
jgi:hypothetical protein